ncbi:MAG: amylo-alpha-1,6-glucosidase [Thermoguttaceae bacterium]
MKEVVRRIPVEQGSSSRSSLLSREWLVTNGLGGYASGTLPGIATRRYHGLLIAALPAPLGRTLMLAQLSEFARLPDGKVVALGGGMQTLGSRLSDSEERLAEFRLENGLPVWRYEADGFVVEKSLFLVHQQNTLHVGYRLLAGPGDTLRLSLLVAAHCRRYDAAVNAALPKEFRLHVAEGRYEITAGPDLPTLRLKLLGRNAAFIHEPRTLRQVMYPIENSRGYDAEGDLWSPGYFRVDLSKQQAVELTASAEPWEDIEALRPQEAAAAEQDRRMRLLAVPARRGGDRFASELVLAADQFIIRPAARREDMTVMTATGDEARSVVAGYHWFTDWGRDTMVSLEGLTLLTGRHVEAGYILRTFAHYIRDGLIPNHFLEGRREGLYHTADATLWFFHALSRYLAYTHDEATLRLLLPRLHEVLDHHVRGTRFGIGVDSADGLLRQGAEGYQLTWMDAKVGDWVVTPRRGKAVEINALWYNALRLMEQWVSRYEGQSAAAPLAELAARTKASFNARFWNEAAGCLFDVVDGPGGDDAACRPNQLFAFTLEHPVLEPSRWEPVLKVVERDLLTPFGLRSLSPSHPDYKARYDGDLRARDAAYHQGTVWAWLIGPFVDAWLRVSPEDRRGARQRLLGFDAHLSDACIGSISEVFDAEPPYTPRGCVAQAWSVAEVLRAWVKTAPDAA